MDYVNFTIIDAIRRMRMNKYEDYELILPKNILKKVISNEMLDLGSGFPLLLFISHSLYNRINVTSVDIINKDDLLLKEYERIRNNKLDVEIETIHDLYLERMKGYPNLIDNCEVFEKELMINFLFSTDVSVFLNQLDYKYGLINASNVIHFFNCDAAIQIVEHCIRNLCNEGLFYIRIQDNRKLEVDLFLSKIDHHNFTFHKYRQDTEEGSFSVVKGLYVKYI